MSREIRRKLEEGRGEATRVKDVLRQSFERHSGERREVAERGEQRRAERAAKIWQDAINEANNGQEGA
jgi:hypothetical protein